MMVVLDGIIDKALVAFLLGRRYNAMESLLPFTKVQVISLVHKMTHKMFDERFSQVPQIIGKKTKANLSPLSPRCSTIMIRYKQWIVAFFGSNSTPHSSIVMGMSCLPT